MSPDFLILVIALTAGSFLLGLPLWKAHRRRRLRGQPLPAEWHTVIEHFVPLYRQMPRDLRARLGGLVRQFLAEKEFIGCNGLQVTAEMRLAVASQACLLILARPTRLQSVYEGLYSILLYPQAFIAPKEQHDEAGVVTRHQEVLTGEAWETHRIVLSWEDIRRDARESGSGYTEAHTSGYNVVLHEFAHYLDAEDGDTNGAPQLDSAADYERWSRVMTREYEQLCEAADRGEETLLDPYGAEEPAEFFAIATESFFGQSAQLKQQHPALYDELMRYYRLDPAAWTGESHGNPR